MQTNSHSVEAHVPLNCSDSMVDSIINVRWVVKNAKYFSRKRLAAFGLLAFANVD